VIGRMWKERPIPTGLLVDPKKADNVDLVLSTGTNTTAPEVGHLCGNSNR